MPGQTVCEARFSGWPEHVRLANWQSGGSVALARRNSRSGLAGLPPHGACDGERFRESCPRRDNPDYCPPGQSARCQPGQGGDSRVRTHSCQENRVTRGRIATGRISPVDRVARKRSAREIAREVCPTVTQTEPGKHVQAKLVKVAPKIRANESPHVGPRLRGRCQLRY